VIKSVFISFLQNISFAFNTKKLIEHSKQTVFMPFYHSINNEQLPHIKNIYPIRSKKLFLNDLDFFTRNFSPVDLNFIIKNRKPEKPVFYLSFDDGLSEIYNIIAPILLKKGIPASFFINTDFVDNKNLFFRYKASLIIEEYNKLPNKTIIINQINKQYNLNINTDNFIRYIKTINYSDKDILDKIAPFFDLDFNNYLQTKKPYLTSNQIKELIKKGFTIGSHSCSHPEYRFIDLKTQISETQKSINFINRNFNVEHKIFSFPFTDFGVNKAFFDYIYNNKIIDYSFGAAGLKLDSYDNHFQRFSIDGTLKSADKLVKAEYLYFLTKKLFNKNKIYRN